MAFCSYSTYRPQSCYWYWTGSSLQWRLMRVIFANAKLFLKDIPTHRPPLQASSSVIPRLWIMVHSISFPTSSAVSLHYSDFFGWKRDNLALTNSSVEGALFIAIVGARCTGLVGETSMCLVMASSSTIRRRKMSARSKGKWGYCFGSLTASALQFPERLE